MKGFRYIFSLSGPLPPELRAQAEEAAEQVLRLRALRRCPPLDRLTRWLNTRPKADAKVLERRARTRPWLGIFNLLLGLFGTLLALVDPTQLLPLLVLSPLCLGSGAGVLWRSHRRLLPLFLLPAALFYGFCGLGDPEFRNLLYFAPLFLLLAVAALLPRRPRHSRLARKDADTLFCARNALPPGTALSAVFTPEGFFWMQGDDPEPPSPTPYHRFLCIAETADLLLVAVEESGFLLQKSELTEGTVRDLRIALSGAVCWLPPSVSPITM